MGVGEESFRGKASKGGRVGLKDSFKTVGWGMRESKRGEAPLLK